MSISIPHKTCTKCHQSFPATAEYFHRSNKGDRYGLRAICKACRKGENRTEARQIYLRRYYITHRDEIILKSADYYEENRETVLERVAQYQQDNMDKVLAVQRNRRARLKNAPGTHTSEDIELQIKAQTDNKGRLHCWWCDGIIEGNDYHIDHRIPLVKGGSNAPDNICITHAFCNLSKGDKLPYEFNGRLL